MLLGLAAWLSAGRENTVAGQLTSIDSGFYDLINRLQPLPPPDDLAIIEIDEASIAQIGRWPWPRGVHATLLDRLRAAGVRTIGLDILIAETGADDETLAAAIARSPSVVLPVASDADDNGRAWPIYPVYTAGQLAHLGHAHFSFDEDGVVRGLYLVEGGNPAFAVATLNAARGRIEQPLVRQALAGATQIVRDRSLSEGIWLREKFVLLPASMPTTVRFSYGDVLRGDADLSVLRDRIVLIGATATGMRDAYSSSIIASQPVAAGIDLHASAINGIARDRLVQRIPFGWHLPLIMLAVMATMIVLYFASPRRGLAAVVLSAVMVGLLSLLALRRGWWIPPAGTMAAVMLAYPLWSWRRLESVIAGLIEQSHTLESEPEVLAIVTDRAYGQSFPQPGLSRRASPVSAARAGAQRSVSADSGQTGQAVDETGDPAIRPGLLAGMLARIRPPTEPVTMELRSLRAAAERIDALRLLLITAVERLPHAALVCGLSGHLIIRNRLARSSFPALAGSDDISAWQWLDEEFGDQAQASIEDSLANKTHGAEFRDRAGRDWLMDAQHVETDGLPALWLIQFTDITRIRELQRERDEMMRFISHDLRSPQVSIIGALDQIEPTMQSEWTTAIRQAATHSLDLAESFIQWTRAENKPIELQEIDLADITTEAVDAAWPTSNSLKVPIVLAAPESAPIIGDAQLIRRAVGNLIDNAFKYGGSRNQITVSLVYDADYWVLTVADRGPGLGDIDLLKVFEPYVRGMAPQDQRGTGLGLALVRMVASRHGGVATAQNRSEGGASFQMTFRTDPRQVVQSSEALPVLIAQ